MQVSLPSSKRHFDRFSRCCRAHRSGVSNTETDTQHARNAYCVLRACSRRINRPNGQSVSQSHAVIECKQTRLSRATEYTNSERSHRCCYRIRERTLTAVDYSLYFTMGQEMPPKLFLLHSPGGSGQFLGCIQPSPSEQHFDQFSRFSTAEGCDQRTHTDRQTDRHTDHATMLHQQ